MSTVPEILRRSDAGEYPDAIAEAVGVSKRRVYKVLSKHRPDRQRKPRESTSEKVPLILGLRAQGIRIGRIAALAECSRAYVHRVCKNNQ